MNGLQVNQCDEPIYVDYSSFGSHAKDENTTQADARANYQELVHQITSYERTLAVHARIAEDGIDLSMGENTSIFEEQIDNGIIRTLTGTNDVQLSKIRFSTLLDILIWKALNLNNHDRIVSNGHADPFAYNLPGYSSADFSGDADDELYCIFSEALQEVPVKQNTRALEEKS